MKLESTFGRFQHEATRPKRVCEKIFYFFEFQEKSGCVFIGAEFLGNFSKTDQQSQIFLVEWSSTILWKRLTVKKGA